MMESNSNVQQTSITAYNEEVKSGKIPSQRKRIEMIIKGLGPLSRRSIRDTCKRQSKITKLNPRLPDIPMSSVCGRVRCLIDSNLIHVWGHITDLTTGKRVQVLKWGPKPKINGDNQYEMDLE